MSWRQRYESLIIVYDLERPRRRVIDYIAERVKGEGAVEWAKFLARMHGMKRFGFILYHKALGVEAMELEQQGEH